MTKKKKLTQILKFILKLSSLSLLASVIIFFFTKTDSVSNNIALLIAVFGGLFIFLIFSYFIITGVVKLSFRLFINLTRHFLSRLKREPLIIINFALAISLFVILFGYQNRIKLLEDKFGGREKVECSQEGVKNILSQKVVRIIGSYAEGSGFPISDDTIITSFHVIEGETSPKVVFPDGTIETPIKILGNQTKDFVMLTLEKKIEPLPFYGWFGTTSNYSDLSIGEPLYASGYPLGSEISGEPVVLKGSFAGKRWLENFNMNVVEANIGLIHGMSGGPLVDSCGQVVGINTLGIGGLSMYLDIEDVQKGYYDATNEEVSKIEIDTSTQAGLVEAYYTYIKTRNLEKAFELISSGRKSTISSFEDWVEGYTNTLHVNLIMVEAE
ncbi:serine protease, partial [Patescibacteria group bacterium]|nr:serine protease [Patescibacteria group bacterium]